MAKESTSQNPTELAKAKQLVEQEKKERSQKAWKEIEAVLQANNCSLDCAIVIGDQSVPASSILKEKIILHVIAR